MNVKPRVRFHRGVYEIVIYNKEFAMLFLERYLILAGNKASKNNISSTTAWTRVTVLCGGYFDSDESIYYHRVGNYIYTELKFKSKSKIFLKGLRSYLINEYFISAEPIRVWYSF